MNKYETVKLNTARNALFYIIKAFKIQELYMPYYLCPSMRITAVKANCKLKFYHIDKQFMPVVDFPLNAFILYPDYFGVCSFNIELLAPKYTNLIVDNAHAFFNKPKGIAAFNSLRKFFPQLRDGAFLYTTKTIDFNIVQDDFEYIPKEMTFEELCKNENRLDNEKIKYMSECSYKSFLTLDLSEKREKFIKNFNNNHKKYKNKNKLKIQISNETVPYKYPYLFDSEKEADNFVKEYETQGKIIFRYWNNLPESYKERDFYTKLAAL